MAYGRLDHELISEDVETQREMESLQRVVAVTAEYVPPAFSSLLPPG